MGAVFRARDPQGRPVALKVMLGHGSSAVRLERFRRELELTQGLRHPGIVTVLGGGVEGELPCMILELVEGTDLLAVFSDPGTETDTKLRILEEVARAIDYAHRQGVIHRDLKPANVLVTQAGRARVTDFGLARDLDRQTRLTVTGAGLGTPAYMSPEQVVAEKETSGATDIYALGVMLFEALTGELPFDSSTPMALYDSILKTKAPRPSELSPQISAGYDRLVERAMAKDPRARPATAGEFARELEALRLGLTPQRGGPWPWIALVGFLVGAAGVAYGSLPRAPLPPPATPVATPTANQTANSTVPPELMNQVKGLLEEGDPEQALGLLKAGGQGESTSAEELRQHFAACDRAAAALTKVNRYTPKDHAQVPSWLKEAETALAEAGPSAARSPRALLLRARLADVRLETAAAKRALSVLLRLPASSRRDETYTALLIAAELATVEGDRTQALKHWVQAIKLRPNRAPARLRRLTFAGRTGGWGDKELMALKRDFPDDPDVLSTYSSEIFRRAMLLAPDDPKRIRGITRAEASLRKAAAAAERPSPFLVGLGYVLRAQGRERESLVMHARALEASKARGLVAYWYRVGTLARRRFETERKTGDHVQARHALLRGQARDDGNPSIESDLAILRYLRDAPRDPSDPRWEAVRQGLEAAIQFSPANWEPFFYLGQTLRRAAPSRTLAVKAFSRALELKGPFARGHVARGATFLTLGQRDQAEADAKAALTLKPGWEPAKALLLKAKAR